MVIQIGVDTKGVTNLRDELGKIITRIKKEKNLTPKLIAEEVRKNTKEVIQTEAVYSNFEPGPAKRAGSAGMAEELMVIQRGDGVYSMGPAPGSPSEGYALAVELGTKGHAIPMPSGGVIQHPGSDPQRYFQKGLIQSKKQIDAEIDKTAKRIISYAD